MATLTDNVYELVQRMRRVETRQAKYLASIGFESGTRMPLWFDDGVVEVPSRVTSLADIMSVVPEDWDRDYEITILFQGQVVGAVLRP
jgi:hypothetical protein